MKNKGYFRITDEFIKTLWPEFSLIFKDFRPTHIELRHWENNIWYYYGVSDLFGEIKEAEEIPQYEIIFTRNGKNVSYEFNRV